MKFLQRRSSFAAVGQADELPVVAFRPGDEDAPDRLPAAAALQVRGSGWTSGCKVPFPARDADGQLRGLLFPLPDSAWPKAGPAFPFGSLPRMLAQDVPVGRDREVAWRVDGLAAQEDLEAAALGWLLGQDQVKPGLPRPGLVRPPGVNAGRCCVVADAVRLARCLISEPANRLGPAALARAAGELAAEHGATFRCEEEPEVLREAWPLVYAVGRAAEEGPRVAEILWGDPAAPRIAVVGKGVTFDTGGVNLKPAGGMRLMGKDMGGAATALALAHMVMARRLPVRLRVLLPIAENAVSSRSFRPGDVYTGRSGLRVEIGNTDAEGRLLLADALHAAGEDEPELVVDFATLTGAARVALGRELPALFANDDDLAEELRAAGLRVRDPLWRMPLWKPYAAALKTKQADLSSTGDGAGAGSVTAALFLQRFVPETAVWAHVDLFAWNTEASPGKPKGGECQAARAVFAMLESRYPPAGRGG